MLDFDCSESEGLEDHFWCTSSVSVHVCIFLYVWYLLKGWHVVLLHWVLIYNMSAFSLVILRIVVPHFAIKRKRLFSRNETMTMECRYDTRMLLAEGISDWTVRFKIDNTIVLDSNGSVVQGLTELQSLGVVTHVMSNLSVSEMSLGLLQVASLANSSCVIQIPALNNFSDQSISQEFAVVPKSGECIPSFLSHCKHAFSGARSICTSCLIERNVYALEVQFWTLLLSARLWHKTPCRSMAVLSWFLPAWLRLVDRY